MRFRKPLHPRDALREVYEYRRLGFRGIRKTYACQFRQMWPRYVRTAIKFMPKVKSLLLRLNLRCESLKSSTSTSDRNKLPNCLEAVGCRRLQPPPTMAQQVFLRTARTFLTAVRPASQSLHIYRASIPSRCLSNTALSTTSVRRPTIRMNASVVAAVTSRMEVVKGVQEQARGMKVRSSVKKLCEGCKVRR